MHYIIIGILIIFIIYNQLKIFLDNKKKINTFKHIFPNDKSDLTINSENLEIQIQTSHTNQIFDIIISSLNNYLNNNKGVVADYHLMKDIVERNCDAIEEEIHLQIPIPLYLGLAGTMLGILIGVGFLVFSGSLNDLLNPTTNVVLNGIETLLGGVALAMISSIFGIILTTFGSQLVKSAKTKLENNKNTFLSWIQSILLPNFSTDVSSSLIIFSQNLSNFNSSFSKNINNLRESLEQITDLYQKQKELIDHINNLKVIEIANANISVYDKLKNCTNEIGTLAQYLSSVNEFLTKVQSLSEKLDEYEKRTQVIENAGKFFQKNEIWLAENMDQANLEIQKAIKRFEEDTNKYFSKLQDSLNEQILSFNTIIQNQQENLKLNITKSTEIVQESFIKTQQAFEKAITKQLSAYQNKLNEISTITEEIKNLKHIKEGIKEFRDATDYQNKKIDTLTQEIRALAKSKIDGGIIKQEISLPKWLKILFILSSSILTFASFFYIISQLISLLTK